MEAFQAVILILIGCCLQRAEPKAQYVMPMSMGMKMSIPYDIANLFIRPIAGVVGVAISIGLLLIIFFGIITSPFGYFFGIPSRKYVLGTVEAMPRLFSPAEPRPFSPGKSPGLLSPEALFFWMDPEELEGQCQLLALCHAHSAIQLLPPKVLRLYKIFSGVIGDVPLEYRRAMVLGLSDLDLCPTHFGSCPHSGFSLIVKTLLRALPQRVKNENFRKRKGPMYLDQR